MADVHLSAAEALGTLPPICMQCGKPANSIRRMRLTSTPLSQAAPPGGGEIGCLFSFLSFLPWFFSRRSALRAPLCRWHRWIVPPSFELMAETDGTLLLRGVSDPFREALLLQRSPP
jgi:hypothetical protein